MKLDKFEIVDGKKLRVGYTTGTCAVATTKAALEALCTGNEISLVKVSTPAGVNLTLEVQEIARDELSAHYMIIKDAGDDPDITNGSEIHSTVTLNQSGKITIDGGTGVGRITKKGLFGEIGEAAINPVPRKELVSVIRSYPYEGVHCLIEVPEGERLAKKTFNPHFGIEGGISIIGTKGLVYPMSQEAYIKTMFLTIDKVKEDGFDEIVITPGNYGIAKASEMGMGNAVVEVSNFFGDALRYIESLGFQKIHVIGHIGKMAKIAIGIFNTHSAVADTRMESFVYYLAMMGAPTSFLNEVNQCISAEEALKLCRENGYGEIVSEMEAGSRLRIQKYIRNDDISIETMIYSMEDGK